MGSNLDRPHKTGQSETIGGSPSVAGGDTTWHLMPQDSFNFKNSVGSVTVDGKVVRALLESYLKGVVESRLQDMRLMERVAAELDRRVELAVKAALAEADVAARTETIRRAKEKARELVDAMEWSVSVSAESRR